MPRIIHYLKSIQARLLALPVGIFKRFLITQAGAAPKGVHVFYGYDRLPSSNEVAHGGIIKFQRLQESFPNTPQKFNILYLVSSNRPAYALQLVRAAHDIGAKFVLNQNGVAYPAWRPTGWKKVNASMAELLHTADFVFYQSEFARSSSDYFLGKRTRPSSILYNAVDTTIFRPLPNINDLKKLKILSVGSQYHFYPLESIIRTLELVCRSQINVHLYIAGKVKETLRDPVNKLIKDLGVKERITFLPPFTQKEAPDIFARGDILLHTKIQDVCPGVVIEAMSCGLPVVYSISGGVPELVGKEAGVGVPTETTWKKRTSPPPEKWAEAILIVAEKQSYYAEAARQRAVDHFDLKPWIERHRQVFFELLEK